MLHSRTFSEISYFPVAFYLPLQLGSNLIFAAFLLFDNPQSHFSLKTVAHFSSLFPSFSSHQILRPRMDKKSCGYLRCAIEKCQFQFVCSNSEAAEMRCHGTGRLHPTGHGRPSSPLASSSLGACRLMHGNYQNYCSVECAGAGHPNSCACVNVTTIRLFHELCRCQPAVRFARGRQSGRPKRSKFFLA